MIHVTNGTFTYMNGWFVWDQFVSKYTILPWILRDLDYYEIHWNIKPYKILAHLTSDDVRLGCFFITSETQGNLAYITVDGSEIRLTSWGW